MSPLYRYGRSSGFSSTGVDRRAARSRRMDSSRADRPREGKAGSTRSKLVARREARESLLRARFVAGVKRNTTPARATARYYGNLQHAFAQ